MTNSPFNRNDFPVLKEMIYCNHAGVSPIPKQTANVIRLYADQVSHAGAKAFPEWLPKIKQTRKSAAEMLNATSEEIAFVKSTTLGLNNIAWGIQWKEGDVVVIEEDTFPANWYPWVGASAFGAKTWTWPRRGIGLDYTDLEERLKQGGVRLVAATSASFSTGWRHDLKTLGELCKQYDVLLCLDAIQTMGVYPIDVKKYHIDFLSADSHKWLLGPEGAGVMYVRGDLLDLFRDDFIGWLGKEDFLKFQVSDSPPDPTARRFEEGAPNNVGWMAMGASLDVVMKAGINAIAGQINDHRKYLQSALSELGWMPINMEEDIHQSGIVSVHREGIDIDRIVYQLWEEFRIVATNRGGNLRFSPHAYQNREEMEQVAEAVGKLQSR